MQHKNLATLGLVVLSLTAQAGQLTVVQPAQAPGNELKYKSSKVPTYDITKLKAKNKVIPKLNVGEEPHIQSDTTPPAALAAVNTTVPQILARRPSPAPVDVRSMLQLKAPTLQTIKKVDADFKVPGYKELGEKPNPTFTASEVQTVTPKVMSPDEEKLLQALIYLEMHKSYALSIGLLAELMEAHAGKQDDIGADAQYHFARAALALNMPTEHRYYMSKLLQNKNKEWRKLAAVALAQASQPDDLELVPVLDKAAEELQLDYDNADQFFLNRARYFSEKGDLAQAIDSLDEIDKKSALSNKGQFLRAILLYRTGKVDASQKMLAEVEQLSGQQEPDSEFHSMAALTLARLQFQQGNYKDAFQSYLRVNKNNPMWMQAMIEQAWAQILTEDYEGAAGNMYTLHTDFFKNSFAPESYVARSVGYLNLCQYGDGAKVVYSMNKRYGPMKQMLEQYQSKNTKDDDYYGTVRSFFKNPDMKMIDGLHRNFVYELARNPSFINAQSHINNSEDEMTKYNNLSLELVQWERNLLQKQTAAEARIHELQNQQGAGKNAKADASKVDAKTEIENLQKSIVSLKIQYQTAKRARNSIKDVRVSGLERLEQQKVVYKKVAAKVLHDRFNEMVALLNKVLDQSEVLRYEIYSGAGEHLRYQLAGGQITEKEREALKAQEGKSFKWEFHGEVWEDELGHYRSSLKNVCADPDAKVSQN